VPSLKVKLMTKPDRGLYETLITETLD